MAENSKIEWTDHTLNYWWGCEKVSPGCANCYAEKQARRIGNDIWGSGKPRRLIKSAPSDAMKLQAKAQSEGVRQKVFCQSMSDFFEEDQGQRIIDHEGRWLWWEPDAETKNSQPIPMSQNLSEVQQDNLKRKGYEPVTMTQLRDHAFWIMQLTPDLDWIIVTKRPENIRRLWSDPHAAPGMHPADYLQEELGARGWTIEDIAETDLDLLALEVLMATSRSTYKNRAKVRLGPLCRLFADKLGTSEEFWQNLEKSYLEKYPATRSNVWLLTSVENQETAEQRIPELLKCRDLSPVLGLSMEPLLGPVDLSRLVTYSRGSTSFERDVLRGSEWQSFGDGGGTVTNLPRIDWVIVGGESGHDARPMSEEWVRSIRDQCIAANVPFFFKQWGEWYPLHGTGIPTLDEEEEIEPYCWVQENGEFKDHRGEFFKSGCEPDRVMVRIGKKAAGRFLDGQEWSQFPEVRA